MNARRFVIVMTLFVMGLLSGCGTVITGACCDEGACLEVTETECFNRGGTYYGGGSSCEVRRCP